MASKTLKGLLVGMHFNPPAKLLLSALPSGVSLRLQPEPENPWDEAAVKVLVEPSQIPFAMLDYLDQALQDMGFQLEEVLAAPEWMLGHLAASGGKPLSKVPGLQGNLEFREALASGQRRASLAFDAAGNPLVVLVWGGEEALG